MRIELTRMELAVIAVALEKHIESKKKGERQYAEKLYDKMSDAFMKEQEKDLRDTV